MRRLFDPAKVLAAQTAHRAFREEVARSGIQAAYRTSAYPEFMRKAYEAWPGGFFETMEPPHDDRAKLDTVLRFLEEDPFFFRTGYVKQKALRLLRRWRLTGSDRRRIAKIVLVAVDGPPRREFRWQAKAARHADSKTLLPDLLERLDAGGTTAWQALCAAHCALGLGFPTWAQCHADPKPQIAAMRERLSKRLEP